MDSGLHELTVSDAVINRDDYRIENLGISTAVFVPEKPVIGAVQIIHGMNEHKERYYPLMEFLAEKGLGSAIIDNRGHGKSVAKPEDLGYMYDRPDYFMISDNLWLNEFMQRCFHDVPFFVLGHSMGSLAARCMLIYRRSDSRTDGMIISGTPCWSRFTGIAELIESELSGKLGGRYRNQKIYEFAEGFLNRNFEAPPHSWICSDPKVVEKFNNDPKCNFIYTLSGYEALMGLMRRVYNAENWKYYAENNYDLPIHFISGKDDPCMFSEEKFFEATRFLEERGYKNVTHKLYIGMRHEVLNEKNKLTVWNDIAEKLSLWSENFK